MADQICGLSDIVRPKEICFIIHTDPYIHTTSVLSYVLKIDQDCHTYSQCHQVQIALCTTLELQ